MRIITGLFLTFVLVGLTPREAVGQCCAAGNPVSTNCGVPNLGGSGMLDVTYSFIHSSSDTYYRGTRALDKVYAESSFDYSSLALSYGVSDRLRLNLELGYYFNKSQQFINSDYTRYATGISDGTLGISYRTYESDDNLFEIQQTARVTIPLGAFDQEYDGVILPIDFQPSSGNFRYNIGLGLSRRFEDSDFMLLSFGSVEFSQAIETRNTYHKYGNLYNAALMGVYRISPLLQGMLQLRYEIRDRALTGSLGTGSGAESRSAQLAHLNASGGVVAFIAPQITVNAFNAWTLSLQYNYPIYKNIYGEEQLTTRHSVSVSLSRALDFGTMLFSSDSPDAGQGPASVRLAVRGSCGMCRDRIEAIAAEAAFVTDALWDAASQELTVWYAEEEPDMDALGQQLALAGHDAGDHAAPDDVYNSLPDCCHYR